MGNNNYKIRTADTNDRNLIIEFIKSDWNPNHIFVKDPNFFDYFYKNESTYNFIIGVNDSNGNIDAILGFQPYSDKGPFDDIFLALWKARKIPEYPSLGLALLHKLQEIYKPKNIHCLGINKKTINIYKFLGYHVDILKHYCLINHRATKYQIADIGNTAISPLKELKEIFTIKEIKTKDEISSIYHCISQSFSPQKSLNLLIHKYINNAYYNYNIYSISKNDRHLALVVLRKIEVLNSACLRTIDFIGELDFLPDILMQLSNVLFTDEIEYLDLYVAGLSREIMTSFIDVSQEKNLIIPNYFEPFEKMNIDIYFFTSLKNNFCFFKGDGDQDRPSISQLTQCTIV